MKRTVIFDLDGTLLNTIDDLADSMNLALTQHGFPEHPVERYKKFVGNGVAVLTQRAMADFPHTEAQEAAVLGDFRVHYARLQRNKTAPYPGIRMLLLDLNRRGVPVSVLSNKPHEDTGRVVRGYFPEISFFRIVGQSDTVPPKPDPTGVFGVLRDLGCEKEEVLYVGDSLVDMQTAKNAGLYAVGVLWGFRDREELEENGADTLIAEPHELLALLD